MDTQKSLSQPDRLEFPHPSLPHPGWFMGLLDSVVGILVIHMNSFRDHLPTGNAIAAQFIGHDLPGLSIMGCVAVALMSAFQSTCVLGPKLITPESDGLMADRDAPFCQQILDISMAEIESVVEPDSVTDDVWWKSMALVSIHRRIINYWELSCQYRKYFSRHTVYPPYTCSTLPNTHPMCASQS